MWRAGGDWKLNGALRRGVVLALSPGTKEIVIYKVSGADHNKFEVLQVLQGVRAAATGWRGQLCVFVTGRGCGWGYSTTKR